jgi:hypothetical protein
MEPNVEPNVEPSVEPSVEPIGYIADFTCTYTLIDDEDMSDALYRSQFIQAFGLDTYDDSVIATRTRELFDRYGGHVELAGCIIRNRKHCFLGDGDFDSFQMMFRYDTFHILHDCLSGLIRGDDLPDNWIRLHAAI